ncbi:unnamed protein product [Closterium sp. NIES-54]
MSRPTSLAAGEIAEQLLLVSQRVPIRNVVFMGMGEPFNNHAAVKAAVELMVAPHGFHMSPNHITVSTVGVVPHIRSFASAFPSVNLALSLHAPSQSLRVSIVPSARAYSLDKLMGAVDEYQKDSGRRVFIEYILLGGVNDSISVAHELGLLLQSRNVVVNLIPYNHTEVVADYRPSTPEVAEAFQKVLRGSYGILPIDWEFICCCELLSLAAVANATRDDRLLCDESTTGNRRRDGLRIAVDGINRILRRKAR